MCLPLCHIKMSENIVKSHQRNNTFLCQVDSQEIKASCLALQNKSQSLRTLQETSSCDRALSAGAEHCKKKLS